MKPSTVVEPASLCISVFITEGSVARIRALSRASNTIRFSALQEHRACCFADRTFYLSWPIARPLVLVLIFFFFLRLRTFTDNTHPAKYSTEILLYQKDFKTDRTMLDIREAFFYYNGILDLLEWTLKRAQRYEHTIGGGILQSWGIIFELFRTNICLR